MVEHERTRHQEGLLKTTDAFVKENLQVATIAFFGAHLQLPLGVSLLLAAILGVVIVLVPSFSRITQLRRTLRRAASGK